MCLLPSLSFADVEQNLIKRIAVFPIADANLSSSEDAWWQMRELLTKDQKFLVASRRFMINRGVFQPRKSLKPADAIILSKILDAHALVISFVEDRVLKMKVYEGENGYLLWEGESQFHPAIPINDQLIKVSLKLMTDFSMAIPYQGYQVIDDAVGKPIFEDDSKKIALVFVGANSEIQSGDTVQWVKVTGDISKAFFNSNPKVTVIAEGKVRKIRGDRVEVEVQKMRDLSDLNENALVRFPREMKRLQDLYSGDEKTSNLSAEYLSSEIKSAAEFNKDQHPTSTALAWIINMATIVLLAF